MNKCNLSSFLEQISLSSRLKFTQFTLPPPLVSAMNDKQFLAEGGAADTFFDALERP
jgi:hypothetical protein